MLTDLVNRDDVGMVQGRRRARFLLESAQTGGIRSQLPRQDFDRDVAPELCIPRPIDSTTS